MIEHRASLDEFEDGRGVGLTSLLSGENLVEDTNLDGGLHDMTLSVHAGWLKVRMMHVEHAERVCDASFTCPKGAPGFVSLEVAFDERLMRLAVEEVVHLAI